VLAEDFDQGQSNADERVVSTILLVFAIACTASGGIWPNKVAARSLSGTEHYLFDTGFKSTDAEPSSTAASQ